MFLIRVSEEVDLNRRGGGEQLGGTQGREIRIRIYYVRKKNNFEKKNLLVSNQFGV